MPYTISASYRRTIVASGAPLPAPEGLWWWQFHQRVMAFCGHAATHGSFASGWDGRNVGVLSRARAGHASVTLRLNLLFTSVVHRPTVALHRRRMFPWIAAAEAVLAVALLGSAATIAGQHEATAAMLICLAIVIAASLAVIEPATTRGAGLTADPTASP